MTREQALAEIVRLRLATDEGSLRVRADRMWEIATAALAAPAAAEPDICGNWTPQKAGVSAQTIADHYGNGWVAGRQTAARAGLTNRPAEDEPAALPASSPVAPVKP